MWNNFKAMPTILKFLTAHALFSFLFLIGSIIPHDSFSINGQSVSYSEWWSSGVGPYASSLGILMPIVGFLLIARTRYARIIYLMVISLGLIVPYLYFGKFELALVGVIVMAVISAYLYLRPPVKEYFASNKALQSDAAEPRR